MPIKETVKEISKSVPESFYDALAYLIPGTFLIICPIFISSAYKCFVLKYYNTSTVVFDKMIIVILVLFLSYVLGQVLTSISWILHGFVCGFFSKIFKINAWTYKDHENWMPFIDENFDRDWTKDFGFIREKNSQIGLEVTKRYARYILARNNTVVGIIIIFFSLHFEKSIFLSLTFMLLFLFDSYIRRCWFLSYVSQISDGLKTKQE
jgi:hypothetical protein